MSVGITVSAYAERCPTASVLGEVMISECLSKAIIVTVIEERAVYGKHS
jgi:hypothetical protein